MDETSVLKELNLTEREAKIYLTLLELGSSLASRIAERAAVNRSLAYETLNSLITKGFVGYIIKENRKYFSAAEPGKLLDLLQEKERRLREILPKLESIKRPLEEETKVQIFKGREGFKTVMNDMIKEPTVLYGIGYTAKGPEIDPVFFAHWQRRRIRRKIKRKYVITPEIAGKEAIRAALTEVRILPYEFRLPSSTIIYGNKSLIFFPEEKGFTGIVIESKGITETNKKFFRVLWEKSKKLA